MSAAWRDKVGMERITAYEERLELVERVLASVAPSRPAIDAAWAAEAAERMAAYDRGEVETFDADDVLAELR
jgi:putative addiction module component (TIGR02574 family)